MDARTAPHAFPIRLACPAAFSAGLFPSYPTSGLDFWCPPTYTVRPPASMQKIHVTVIKSDRMTEGLAIYAHQLPH